MSRLKSEKSPHPRSVDGVAARNGVCRATLYNENARGNLRFTKIGSRTIITEKQEAEWLESLSGELCPSHRKKKVTVQTEGLATVTNSPTHGHDDPDDFLDSLLISPVAYGIAESPQSCPEVANDDPCIEAISGGEPA